MARPNSDTKPAPETQKTDAPKSTETIRQALADSPLAAPKPGDVARQGPAETLPTATPPTSGEVKPVAPTASVIPNVGGTPAKGESEDGPPTGGEPMNPPPETPLFVAGATPSKTDADALYARLLDLEKRLTVREADLISRERALLATPAAAQEDDDDAKDMVSIVNQRHGPIVFYIDGPGGLPQAVTLNAGVNTLPKATWEKVKALPNAKGHLEAGKDPDAKQGLRDMGSSRTKDVDDTNASIMVRNMRSEEALSQALRGEFRPHVLAAAKAQEKRLRHPLPGAGGGSGRLGRGTGGRGAVDAGQGLWRGRGAGPTAFRRPHAGGGQPPVGASPGGVLHRRQRFQDAGHHADGVHLR